MKATFLYTILMVLTVHASAQKQTFDVISFSIPQGWQQRQNDTTIQLSAADKKTSGYAMVIITRATPSTASAHENFNSKWAAAIKSRIQLDGAPVRKVAIGIPLHLKQTLLIRHRQLQIGRAHV